MHKAFLIHISQLLILLTSISITGKAFATGDNQAVDFHALASYARLANASYLPADKVGQTVESAGYRLSDYNTIPTVEIAYILATDDSTRRQIIAIRGTANIENALVDVALKLVTDPHAGIRLHNGFAQAAEKVLTNIKPLLKKDYTISTTGHSLGGAVAMILALYLHMDDFNIGQVVSFGQPKVTNISGATVFNQLDIIRVVTPKDIVPLVPPLDPVDINDLDIYWHAGREIVLLEDTRYALLEGLNSMLRAGRFTQEPLTENNLHHHRMALYLQALDEKQVDARQAPYNNRLNLFNLFGGD